MAICKPTTLASIYGNTILSNGATSSTNAGMLLSPQSSVFSESILSFEEIIRKQNNPAERYDRTTLLSLTTGLNTSLRRVDLINYPTLKSRVQQGIILYPEIADFLNQSALDLDEVNTAVLTFQSTLPVITSPDNVIAPASFVTSKIDEVLKQLDFYYEENAANNISGGFCGAFGNPFGQIMEIVGAIQVGKDLLSKLLDFAAGFNLNDLLSPLNTIKDMLLSVVDKLKETLQAQLDGIISSVTGIVDGLKDFANNAMEFFHSKIQAVKTFLKDFSLDTIKQSIEGLIDDAVKQFEELTPEALALLMFRFCQFSEMIQSFMKAPIDGLKSLATNFATSIEIQRSRGLEQSLRAIASGATRFDEDARRRLRREAASRGSPNRDRRVEPRDRGPDGEYYASVEELTPAERNALANLGREGIPGKFTFGPGVTNMDRDLGFTEVRPRVWVGLLKVINRLQRMGALSGPLLINSAYRSPAYNRALARRTSGVATNSQHTTGLALDVNMRGMGGNDFERQFIRVASQEGFTAIGVYNTFIHIDMRDNRNYWPQGSRHQRWLEAHFRDEFRNGAAAPQQDTSDVTAALVSGSGSGVFVPPGGSRTSGPQ